MKRYVIIVAGGSGQRMHSHIPKQFLLLCGKPILMHTVEKFAGFGVVVVLPQEHINYWQQLCQQYAFSLTHSVTAGGGTRLESVMNGLRLVPDDALVAVHDGVRPLVTRQMIEEGFRVAETYGNAVPVVPLADSLRHLSHGDSSAVPREEYRLVQTPQIFRAAEIKDAYTAIAHSVGQTSLTDDASVLEAAGKRVFLYDGCPENIKITTPQDLILAQSYYAEYQRL